MPQAVSKHSASNSSVISSGAPDWIDFSFSRHSGEQLATGRAEVHLDDLTDRAARIFLGTTAAVSTDESALAHIQETFAPFSLSLTSHPLGSLSARIPGYIKGLLSGEPHSEIIWKAEAESSFRRRVLYAGLEESSLSRLIYAATVAKLTSKESCTVWMDADGWPTKFGGMPMLEALGRAFGTAVADYKAIQEQDRSGNVLDVNSIRLQLRLDQSHLQDLKKALRLYHELGILKNLDRIIISRATTADGPLSALRTLDELQLDASVHGSQALVRELSRVGITIFVEDLGAVRNLSRITADVAPRCSPHNNPGTARALWVGFGFSDLNKDCGGVATTQAVLRSIEETVERNPSVAGVLLGGSQSPERGRFTQANLRNWSAAIKERFSALKMEFSVQDDLIASMLLEINGTGREHSVASKPLSRCDSAIIHIAEESHRVIQSMIAPVIAQARLSGIGGEPFSARPSAFKSHPSTDLSSYYDSLRAIPVVHDHYSIGLPIVAADIGNLLDRLGQPGKFLGDARSEIRTLYPAIDEILRLQAALYCPDVVSFLYPFLKCGPIVGGDPGLQGKLADICSRPPDSSPHLSSAWTALLSALDPAECRVLMSSFIGARREERLLNRWVLRAFDTFGVPEGDAHSSYRQLLRARALECREGKFCMTSPIDDILTLERGFYG